MLNMQEPLQTVLKIINVLKSLLKAIRDFSTSVMNKKCNNQLIGISIPGSNNTRDLESDSQAGAVTLAILLGKHYACAFYSFLLLFPVCGAGGSGCFPLIVLHVTADNSPPLPSV